MRLEVRCLPERRASVFVNVIDVQAGLPDYVPHRCAIYWARHSHISDQQVVTPTICESHRVRRNHELIHSLLVVFWHILPNQSPLNFASWIHVVIHKYRICAFYFGLAFATLGRDSLLLV